MLTFHVIPLFLVIASEAWNLKVCACAMILDSSLRSATFRMTECQHYLVKSCLLEGGFGEGDHFVQSTTSAIARTIMIARITCSAANRKGIHRSIVVTAL